MNTNENGYIDDREKLFNEVWKEPMTTLAKRYGISDNGLRKRCNKLRIPLPPAGYWAKLKAGKKVMKKPKLPPLSILAIYGEGYEGADDSYYEIREFIEIDNIPDDELSNIDGLDLLTNDAKEAFLKRCSRIKIPSKIEHYDTLIKEHQNEIEYRKVRDKEYRLQPYFFFLPWKTKVENRNNRAVLSIQVSDKQASRAYKIIDTIFKAVKEFNGISQIDTHDKDSCLVSIFGHSFEFLMIEHKVKRRDLISNSQQENIEKKFRPMYESVFNGELEIEFKERFNYWEKGKIPKTVIFSDCINSPIENQLGEIFKELYKLANENKIANVISENKSKKIEEEQKRVHEIEEENKRKLLEIEERNRRKQHLVQNIEQQMDGWFKAQKLLSYAKELEVLVAATNDETTKELLSAYISLVRKKAEKLEPIKDVLNELKAIELNYLND